jgi:ATP-binding cassette, subfamily B, bacterial
LGSNTDRTRERGGVLFLYVELWRLAHGRRHRLAAACALLIGAQVLLLGVPYVAARAINELQLHGFGGMTSAGWWLSMALAITAASWLLHGPGRVLERNVSLYVRQRLSVGLVERLLTLPLSWHEAHHSGATAHRVQQSSHALSSFAQSQFIYLNSAVRLVGPVLALWYIEPIVGAAAITGFAVICLSVVGFDRAMVRLARRENDAERRYQAALVDVLGNTTTLFALRQARGVLALVERRLSAVFEPLRRSIFLNEAKWCTVDIATRALSCVLVALFAWRASRVAPGSAATATLMLGSVYMVWEYAVQSGGVIAAVAQHFQTFARQHADYTSADVVRDAAPAHFATAASASTAQWERLDVHELTFRHAGSRGGPPQLDRVAFSLERGKRYALVGGSGSGKSTLLRVLAGLYATERVALTFDSRRSVVAPVEAARLLRASATLIPQDAELYEGTLAENLSLCESVSGPPSPRAFAPALDVATASAFVDSTNVGLETVVAERAANWSGGQRSRIALARGVLAAEGSSLVLLDEPTAHLDAATEQQVYANLFDEFADACTVSAVHRLNLLDQFDEVLLMQAGRLVAQGSRAALEAGSPEFRHMLASYRNACSADAAVAALAIA